MNIGLSKLSMWLFKLSWLTNLTCVGGGSLTKPKNFFIEFKLIKINHLSYHQGSCRRVFSVLPMAGKINFMGVSKNFRSGSKVNQEENKGRNLSSFKSGWQSNASDLCNYSNAEKQNPGIETHCHPPIFIWHQID